MVSAIPQIGLLDKVDVAQILGISTGKLDQMRRSDDIPQPLKVGKRSLRWRPETIRDFVEGLATC